MTYGRWLTDATHHLRTAADRIRAGAAAADAADRLAAAAARQSLYRNLARHVRLLVGGQPGGPIDHTQAAADRILSRHGDHLTRLYVGLRTASDPTVYYPAGAATSTPSRALRAAADAVATAGDVLASHLRLPAGPHTAEGSAIRAGGGVAAALADIAALTETAIRVDRRLPRWLSTRTSASATTTISPATFAAQWTIDSRLGSIAHTVRQAGRHQPALLHDLDVAPGPPTPDTIATDSPAHALASVRTWLRHHPNLIHASHLAAGTQLGLALQLLQPGDLGPELGQWRTAATAAAQLHGTPPPDGPSHDSSRILHDLHTWARHQL